MYLLCRWGLDTDIVKKSKSKQIQICLNHHHLQTFLQMFLKLKFLNKLFVESTFFWLIISIRRKASFEKKKFSPCLSFFLSFFFLKIANWLPASKRCTHTYTNKILFSTYRVGTVRVLNCQFQLDFFIQTCFCSMKFNINVVRMCLTIDLVSNLDYTFYSRWY